MTIAELCYRLTRKFPKDELFGLISQIGRSLIQFLRIAQGSLKELETQLLVSQRVSIVSEADVSDLLKRTGELGKMLRALTPALQAKER